MKKNVFNFLNIQKVPDDEYGIYSIWSKNICVYVGQARRQDLQTRLLQHYSGSHNEKLKNWIQSSHQLWFAIEPVHNSTAIDAKERNRIKAYAPITNKLALKKEHQYGNKLTSL